jgi:hypothetical protein
MLAFGQPQQHLASGPPVVTTCTHARCRNVHKPGPRPMSVLSCPASTMDTTIGQPSGHRLSGRSGRTPSTPPGTPWQTGSDADREPTNGTEGVRTARSPMTTRRLTGTRRAPPVGQRLRLGNQGWAGDGEIASATVTTAATRQLLGVAPPSRPRLGALLSCVGCGGYEEKAMGLRKGAVCGVRLGGEC